METLTKAVGIMAIIQLAITACRYVLPVEGYVPRGSILAITEFATEAAINLLCGVLSLAVFALCVFGLSATKEELHIAAPVVSVAVMSAIAAEKTDASLILASVQGIIASVGCLFLIIVYFL